MTVLLAIPTGRGEIHIQTVGSIRKLKGITNTMYYGFALPDVARNNLCQAALDYDYIFFMDDDMVCPADTVERMLERNVDICTGLCFRRNGDHLPCVYESIEPGAVKEYVTPFPPFFEVEGGCGMAACLIKTDVLKKIGHDWFTHIGNIGEDFSFCMRAKELGYKIYCDSTIPISHIGVKEYGINDYIGTRMNWKADVCTNYCRYGESEKCEKCSLQYL